MPLKKAIYDEFVYFLYERTEFKDVIRLKGELNAVLDTSFEIRDIVLDLSRLTRITSPELGIIAGTLRRMSQVSRTLFVISSGLVNDVFVTTNLLSLEDNLMIYHSLRKFMVMNSITNIEI